MEWVYVRITRSWKCDVSNRWKWVERHKKGADVFYTFDIYDPTKGWALKPDTSNLASFVDKTVNSNSKGIRGKIEYPYLKDESKPRILVLGDSFTFGEEVNDDESFPHYLQQTLPDTEVINFGVHGYGHDQMLIYLKEEGIKYKPDIVILGYHSMDSERNMQSFRDYAKPKFSLRGDRLVLSNSPVPSAETVMKSTKWESKFISLVKILVNKVFLKIGVREKQEKALTLGILKEIAATSKNIGAVPIFAYITNLRSEETLEGMTSEEKIFFEDCKKIGVDCIFLRQHVQREIQKGLKIKMVDHYDAKTNEIIASGIKDHLINNGLVA